MPVPSNVLHALTELLAVQSPQVASRLKQRLNAALQAKGADTFDERKHGFKGFRDFLQRGTEGLFVVKSTDDGADVVVSLPVKAPAAAPTAGTPIPAIGTTVRSEIWQAFTNPDATRLRFLNKRTFVVRHFLRGEDSAHSREVDAAPEDFVPVEPITGEDQLRWMREFIDLKGIEQPHRALLEAIMAKPYTSGLNAAFTGALRQLGKEWSAYRVKHVIEKIAAWAKPHGISAEHLNPRPAETVVTPVLAPVKKPASVVDSPSSGDGVMDPRAQASGLLAMLSDDEIRRVVLPILLSTMLVRGKA